MNRNPLALCERGRSSFRQASILLLWPLLTVVACNADTSAVRDIGPGAIVEDARFPPKGTSAQRFGFRPAPTAAASSDDHGPDYTWETPTGWVELPPSSFRVVNFLVAGDERAECYLSVLSGDGGGLAANINRWRKQMQLPELDPDAVNALPTSALLGAEAVVFDATGTWSGMNGEGGESNQRMLGLLAIADTGSRFLKLVGPADIIAGEIDAFASLARSLKDAHAGHNHAAPASRATVPSAPTSGGGLAWDVPTGWQTSPPRMMRIVSFSLAGTDENECYVSILGGDGGGSLNNVNRWRGQMGQPALTITEFEALERIPVLEGSALMIEIEGEFQGMAGSTVNDALMLGVIRELPDRTVFVKMTGVRDVLVPERDAFVTFCRSLRFAADG
jgi:hypothetical protein